MQVRWKTVPQLTVRELPTPAAARIRRGSVPALPIPALNKLNAGDGTPWPHTSTSGPAAASDPHPCVFQDQLHVFYRDPKGIIWDAYYTPSGWLLAQTTTGNAPTLPSRALTLGPDAVGEPAPSWPLPGVDQLFVVYRDGAGTIWAPHYV